MSAYDDITDGLKKIHDSVYVSGTKRTSSYKSGHTNDGEYPRVKAYLDGGAVPSPWPTTLMGQGLSLVERGRRTLAPEPPPPPGDHEWWSDASPINTLIPSSVGEVLGYGQGVLGAGGFSVTTNGGGWACAIFHDTSGSRRTLTNPDGWKMDNVPEPAQFKAYWDRMNALGDTEKHGLIVDGDRVYNIYGCNRDFTTIASLACFRAVDVSSGFWNNNLGPWSGRASGFSSGTGVLMHEEMVEGAVEHALVCGWPKARIKTSAVSPAVTSDGNGTGGTDACLPMGSRLQLDPSLTDSQLLALGISSFWLPMLHAMQRYGCYIVDSTSRMAIYCESHNDAGAVSWPGGFYGPADSLMARMRCVAPPPMPVLDDRTVFGQPHRP